MKGSKGFQKGHKAFNKISPNNLPSKWTRDTKGRVTTPRGVFSSLKAAEQVYLAELNERKAKKKEAKKVKGRNWDDSFFIARTQQLQQFVEDINENRKCVEEGRLSREVGPC